MTSAIPVNARRPERNACTAISLAAFSAHGAVPPAFAAARASPRHGNASWSTGSKSSLAAVTQRRAVGQPHEAVDDRLRVHHDVDVLVADAEEMVRLDHLQALVHERR